MKVKKFAAFFALMVIMAFSVSAQDTPSDVSDLVGARAAGGETQLKSRGYKFIKTEKGDDRTWSNWWNARKKVCLTVVTMEGRYDSIVAGPAFDCNQSEGGSADSGASGGAPSDVSDLVGARASSGEAELKSRGYRFIKVEKGDDRTWSNWWNSRKKVCLTVVTMEGRYDSIVSGPAFDCGQR